MAERVHQALAHSLALAATGTTAPPSSSTRPQGVASQRPRPGDEAFFKGSVECMASELRVEFSSELAAAVVKTTSALLTSTGRALLHADALSVEAAWARMDCTFYAGQTRAAPTLALVMALRMAHDAADGPVIWPTPEELEEGRRDKKRRGNSRDRGDRQRGGG